MVWFFFSVVVSEWFLFESVGNMMIGLLRIVFRWSVVILMVVEGRWKV